MPDPEPLRDLAPALVPVSGGMDSTVLAWWLTAHRVPHIACLFGYGQHTYGTEQATARVVLPNTTPLLEIDLGNVFARSNSHLVHAPDLWRDATSSGHLHLEYRNLVLIAAAASIAEQHACGVLAPAFIRSNLAKRGDTSREFLSAVSAAVAAGGDVALALPFLELSKSDVVRLGLELGAPIARTFSCQLSPAVACGACANCVDRLDALTAVKEQHRRDG